MKCPRCKIELGDIRSKGIEDIYKCTSCGFPFDPNASSLDIEENDNSKSFKTLKFKLHPWNETFPKKDREPDPVNKYAWKMVGKGHVLVEGDKYSTVSEALRDRLSWVPED